MYVLVDDDFTTRLCEPKDLKAFKLIVRHPRAALPKVSDAMANAAIRTDDEHSWIKEDWLRRQEAVKDDPLWQAAFGDVISYARKKGWFDEATASVRAHIEWSPA